jgi:hypothetical protein
MKKATIIATCLQNSGMRHSLAELENSITQTFREDFPGMSYNQWNVDVPDATAQEIIQNFQGVYRIDVKKFIQDFI